ncbi:MAG: glycosyl transferase, partial [Clostridiales bacterium]|nr:glycosyl transferase [Clostridiales bacterium]
NEQARTQRLTAADLITAVFPEQAGQGALDAEFLAADRQSAVGVSGLPFEAPICAYLLNQPDIAAYLGRFAGSQLLWLEGETLCHQTEDGLHAVPQDVAEAVKAVLHRVLTSPGKLNDSGELLLDLKTYPVGPHYPVNLLLGNRAGYPYPLCTTPKSVLDALGRGSFRATGGQQVLATRCVLPLEENGEPANRQFYLVEDGRQIFYSADVWDNVASASCCHSQNRTVITYQTECGLEIRRTIFILPQEDGMPNAVEAQRVEIVNRSGRTRRLKIVMTGMFGIAGPMTIANDVVYANVVVESEVFYQDGRPAALTLHQNPQECAGEKRFAALLCNGETLDEFCVSLPDFVGSGTLARPELVAHLPSRYNRKMAPFFAMGKSFTVQDGETAVVDEFVGMMETEEAVNAPFDSALHCLLEQYRDPAALNRTLQTVVDFWNRYPSYLVPETEDSQFNAYVGHNLPFQVLYQTYVSRAFAWTQKSYRETGFREIQDIYASMYYLSAIGENDLIKDLISNWVRNVFPMGYAYHNFTFAGKEPGDCSDDQLWLVQAVYRYVELTGDSAFLLEEFPMAGEQGGSRPLWETLMAILTYSGKISVGRDGLPLLDKADWNDTLRLDPVVLKGPEKEALYRKQLAERGQEYGVPFENTMSESVMNACLLKIAADEVAEMAPLVGKEADGALAAEVSAQTAQAMQAHAWKGDFFARCLINDDREGGYTYLGAQGDNLALEPEMDGTYFLNSYSWPILAGVATEEQVATMLERVQTYLKTDAGLKLCTLVAYDRLGVETGTALYFPGDRENGGVFKHAAMMATVASLKAAKWVKDPALARQLAELAFFMIDKTLPYKTMEDPFRRKGNPRFCTQYNNSETGENIGPMLSGTASWLTLAVYESLGVEVTGDSLHLSPLLQPGTTGLRYTINLLQTTTMVEIVSDGTRFRTGPETEYLLDGAPAGQTVPLLRDGGTHRILIRL